MQLLDPTAVVASPRLRRQVVALAASSWPLAARPSPCARPARDRQARRESIPTYYGRLHFAA